MACLTTEQWNEWVEFYKLEPFGPSADDQRHGLLCTVIARTQGSKTSEPHDFMLSERPEAKEETMAERIASMLGVPLPSPERPPSGPE